jgi:hypothetical protein
MVAGTGVASAEAESDPGNTTSPVGVVVNTATEGASTVAKVRVSDLTFVKTNDKASASLLGAAQRIVTNHSLVTAR